MGRPHATDFRDALTRVFARNADTGTGPASIRALAIALAGVDENDDNAHRKTEHWRRNLRRYMSGQRGYTKDTLRRIADAANARVEEFPPPETLRQRVERLERENQELRERLDRRREHP